MRLIQRQVISGLRDFAGLDDVLVVPLVDQSAEDEEGFCDVEVEIAGAACAACDYILSRERERGNRLTVGRLDWVVEMWRGKHTLL